MKVKYILFYPLSLVFILSSQTQCSSSKAKTQQGVVELQKKPSFVLGDIFFQKWVAGVQGGGSGYHLYVPVKENKKHVVFDSAFFRGLKAKLDHSKMGYIASFKTDLNQKPDMSMSGNGLDEYGNIFSHKLEKNECVLSYIEKNQVKYYRVENLIEKQAEYYPRLPPNEE